MKNVKRIAVILLMLALSLMLFGCNQGTTEKDAAKEGGAATEDADGSDAGDDAAPEANGEVYILFTSDVHCGVNQGFGYSGLSAVKENLEKQGYTVILIDNGDAVQGETIGMLTEGESIIDLMSAIGYDIAVPGNHEFDYGMDQFLSLVEKASFKYLSCNLNKEGELLLDPWTIIEAAGIKFGFVGVTTPTTLSSSTPAIFRNDQGEFIYGFLQDETGESVYNAVQKAVDEVRAAGADYVYLLGHMGMAAGDEPWTYADVIEHTTGIDVFLDGHSHDTEQVVMKDKEGKDVIRSGCGTKLGAIGYSHISPEEGIVDTNIWTWNNLESAPTLLGFTSQVSDEIDRELGEIEEKMSEVIAEANVTLTIFDPEEVDDSGNPIRMVRRAETNAGDFCADAYRFVTGADIGFANGGGIRTNIEKGDVTYGDILSMAPFNNQVAIIEATGQQILDALEFGVRDIPEESGGFLHASGLTYEIDVTIPSGCVIDENGTLNGIEGERRIKNVMVGSEALDPEKTYTVGGLDYTLTKNGDGSTAFDGATIINGRVRPDSQALIDYIQEGLGGEIGTGYEDPYGEGRIVIIQ